MPVQTHSLNHFAVCRPIGFKTNSFSKIHAAETIVWNVFVAQGGAPYLRRVAECVVKLRAGVYITKPLYFGPMSHVVMRTDRVWDRIVRQAELHSGEWCVGWKPERLGPRTQGGEPTLRPNSGTTLDWWQAQRQTRSYSKLRPAEKRCNRHTGEGGTSQWAVSWIDLIVNRLIMTEEKVMSWDQRTFWSVSHHWERCDWVGIKATECNH